MLCPNCQSENRDDATFCLECGSPLDEETLAAAPAPRKPIAPAAVSFDLSHLLKPLRWSWSVRLLVLIGIIALVINWMGSTVQQNDSDLYRAARQAQDEHRWHTAATMFKQLADKSYYDSATHYAQVEAQVKDFDSFYGKGSYAENHNQDVLAAYYYNQAAQIEPTQYAVDVTLARLRKANGRILYRIADGARAGLYVAEADGGISLKIPESNADSIFLTASPDGRLVVFSNRENGHVHLFVKDTHSYVSTELDPPHIGGTGRFPEQNVSVALFNGGADLLVIDGGQFTFSNTDPGRPTSTMAAVYHLNDRGSDNIGLVDSVAYPGYYDKLIYYSDSVGDMHSYDITSGRASFAFTPTEHIYNLQKLGADRLFYATAASVTATLYTVNTGQWQQSRKLLEVFSSERPYGTLFPQIIISPQADRLYLWFTTRAKGTEAYLLDLNSQRADPVLRYSDGDPGTRLLMSGFSDSGRGLLLYNVSNPTTVNTTPSASLSVLGESNFEYFFTYPFISSDNSQVVKGAGFLDEATVYYVVAQNGATREFSMGDIIVAPVSNPTHPVKLAQVNTDTISNWQPVILMPDQHTVLYCGNVNNNQGIYINTVEGDQPLKIMDEAVAFWHLGGQ